jgi:hypothetical protein
LPHRITTSSALSLSLSLPNNLRGISFNNDPKPQNWLDDFTAKPVFFKRGIENLPERREAVVNNGDYIIE